MATHVGKSLEIKKDNWPQDLVLSILATLPAKSLLRFKCVSKHWRSMLINPDFVEQHLENQRKKDYPQLVFASTGSKTDIVLESVSIVDVKVEGQEGGVKTRKSFERSCLNICHLPPDVCYMTNSCDGILCFYGKTNVFVYNPGTREFRILQIGKVESSLATSYSFDCFGQLFCRYHLLGLGRDQVTKECKIIRLFRSKGEHENHNHECEVFTLNSDVGASWRGIGEVAYFIRPAQQPAYVNGALHWILDDRHANPSEVIISFDLHTEKFKAISHPSCCIEASLDQYKRHFMGLLSLRNSLCLILPESSLQLQLNIWIMNQSNGIWEKLFCIDWELMNYKIPLAFPITELKDGTFFVCHCGDNLQIYYPESKSFSEVLLRHERVVMPSAYFESLVSFYGEPLVN
ncbi:F-box/LRR-repeat/kelch-repeat protein At1g09650-like [Durio zibethinus]|uniref:F-box/LRR-repeat/kelch-repeat protein At1g09650-like n=1 Tax=Durio zibethinus TaxID=66656 RepID=A0A6P5WV85_DURZI|nr:F-box/LRR-repeat/kelch-repeat protein At1g09650-like [Durio zibethinus]